MDLELKRFNVEEDKIYRVVCTRDASQNKKEMTVDFAIANPEEARITHLHLFKLRKNINSGSEWALPQLFLVVAKNGEKRLEFASQESNTPENAKKLAENTSTIMCEFNKFAHQGLDTTFDRVMDRQTQNAIMFDDVDIEDLAKSPVTNEQERRTKIDILTSRAKYNPDLWLAVHMTRDGD